MYEYTNSGPVYDSRAAARQVHKEALELDIPYFRLKHLEEKLSQSRGAIHYHLKELVRQGYLIQVGQEYVDAQELPEWELWQIKRLWKQLEQEAEKAAQIKEIYQEKKELKQEQLQELKEEMSNRWQRRQVDELAQLQEKIDFQEEKARNMSEASKAVFRLYLALTRQDSEKFEKSGPPGFHKSLNGVQVTA